MSGPVTFTGTAVSAGVRFTCLTGFIMPREQIGFLQRGTHRLISADGRLLAALRSDRISLDSFQGQFRTVCGVDEGQIEGVTSLLVTQVFPPGIAAQGDFRSVLLQLINNRIFR